MVSLGGQGLSQGFDTPLTDQERRISKDSLCHRLSLCCASATTNGALHLRFFASFDCVRLVSLTTLYQEGSLFSAQRIWITAPRSRAESVTEMGCEHGSQGATQLTAVLCFLICGSCFPPSLTFRKKKRRICLDLQLPHPSLQSPRATPDGSGEVGPLAPQCPPYPSSPVCVTHSG